MEDTEPTLIALGGRLENSLQMVMPLLGKAPFTYTFLHSLIFKASLAYKVLLFACTWTVLKKPENSEEIYASTERTSRQIVTTAKDPGLVRQQ